MAGSVRVRLGVVVVFPSRRSTFRGLPVVFSCSFSLFLTQKCPIERPGRFNLS